MKKVYICEGFGCSNNELLAVIDCIYNNTNLEVIKKLEEADYIVCFNTCVSSFNVVELMV